MGKIIQFPPIGKRRPKRGAAKGSESLTPKLEISNAVSDLLSQLLGPGFEGVRLEPHIQDTNVISVQESAEEIIVRFRLNGFLKDEIKIRISSNGLVVDLYETNDDKRTIVDPSKLEKMDLKKAGSQRIPLPMPVEEDTARAEFHNGLISVFLKKRIIKSTSRLVPLQEV